MFAPCIEYFYHIIKICFITIFKRIRSKFQSFSRHMHGIWIIYCGLKAEKCMLAILKLYWQKSRLQADIYSYSNCFRHIVFFQEGKSKKYNNTYTAHPEAKSICFINFFSRTGTGFHFNCTSILAFVFCIAQKLTDQICKNA